MNIDTALQKIYSLKQFHVKLGLDNIRQLLNYLGNPQENLKTIHIAGSNGKGSTCSYIASILQEHNFKTGLYTSPHFVKFNERIRINGKEITDDDIISFLETHKSYIDKEKPTFFEITTAMAFEYFKKNDVDYAVIETGLGGRLDATNVLSPMAVVITSISLEHSHILGDTITKIAFEKGGIIKRGKPVFAGYLPSEAENELRKIAKQNESVLYKVDDYTKISGNKAELNISNMKIEIEKTGLLGSYQLKNSSLALLTLVKIMNDSFNSEKAIEGIKNVIGNTGIQGRYERYGKTSNIIFDAAHNLEGVEIFIKEFKKEYGNYSERTLLFGAMKDKDISKMLNLLKSFFDNIYVTSSNYERAAPSEEIKEIADSLNIKCRILNNPETLVKKFENRSHNECLVVLGSIYLIGEIKKKIIQQI